MDFNKALLEAMLTNGRYDAQMTRESKTRDYMSYFLDFIQLLYTLKMMVILLVPWNRLRVVPYLVDLYSVNESV